MDIVGIIEIFAFLTGIIYIVLEIWQKNAMWVIGILTGAACAYSFWVQDLYASMGLNVYYVAISFWGLYQWRKDGAKLGSADASVHLSRLSRNTAVFSAVLTVLGTAALIWVLRMLGDQASGLDAAVTILSAVATWWLAKSYPQQWLLWIVADMLSAYLCLRVGMYWMSVLYLCYAASALYGYRYWMNKGKYV